MNIIKRILHKHNWETFLDNVNGETGSTFTIGLKQCRECGKYKIKFIYGSGKRVDNRLEPQVNLQGARNEK